MIFLSESMLLYLISRVKPKIELLCSHGSADESGYGQHIERMEEPQPMPPAQTVDEAGEVLRPTISPMEIHHASPLPPPSLHQVEQHTYETCPDRPDTPISIISHQSRERSPSPQPRSPDPCRATTKTPLSPRLSPASRSSIKREERHRSTKRHHRQSGCVSPPRTTHRTYHSDEKTSEKVGDRLRTYTMSDDIATHDSRSTNATEDPTAERVDRILGFLKTVEEDDAKSVATIKTNPGAMWSLECMRSGSLRLSLHWGSILMLQFKAAHRSKQIVREQVQIPVGVRAFYFNCQLFKVFPLGAVFDGVKAKIMGQQLEIEEKTRTLALLKKEVKKLKEFIEEQAMQQ